ncbi:MAG: MraY family glycosyltransferase [Defluviicoccus sp.]
MAYLASGLVSLLVTFAVMPSLARLAVQFGIVDHPNARKLHARPTPLCGGIAMVCGAALPLLLWAPADERTLQCLAAGLLVFVVGIYDDCRGLHFRWRLLWQTVAAILIVQAGLTIEHVPFLRSDPALSWLALPLTLIFIVGVTNAVNLLDGLDGLAGGCVLLSFLAIAVVAPSAAVAPATLVAAVAIGALFAFLRFNSHRAMVFMGDAGSTLLGLVLAVAGILLSRAGNGAVSPILILPLIGLPIVDTMQVIIVRLLRGRSPFAADRSHLHHRLLSLGLHHREAVLVLYALQALLMGSALILRDAPERMVLLVFAVQAVLSVLAIQLPALLGWRYRPEAEFEAEAQREELGKEFAAPSGAERRNQWLRRQRWLPSLSSALVRIAVAVFLLLGSIIPGEVPPGLAVVALLAAVLVLLEDRGMVAGGFAMSRLGAFAAAMMACHLMMQGYMPTGVPSGWMLVGFGIGFMGLLTIAVRVTRRQVFPLSTQDGLAVLAALGLFGGMVGGVMPPTLGGPVIALTALFYGCEFVFVRDRNQLRLIRLATVASLVIVGTRGLLT